MKKVCQIKIVPDRKVMKGRFFFIRQVVSVASVLSEKTGLVYCSHEQFLFAGDRVAMPVMILSWRIDSEQECPAHVTLSAIGNE